MPDKIVILIMVLSYIKIKSLYKLKTKICKFSEGGEHCNPDTWHVVNG